MIMQERADPNYLKERMPPRPGTFVTHDEESVCRGHYLAG